MIPAPVLALLLAASPALADSSHAPVPVIVDLDAAHDDLRALGLLLEHPEVEVLGVTVVDGIVAPEDGARMVGGLAAALGHPDLVVAVGQTHLEPLSCRPTASSLDWGVPAPGFAPLPDAPNALVELLHQHEEPAVVLALGPLTNLAAALALEPSLGAEVSAVVWAGDVDSPAGGTNHDLDPTSASAVFGADLPLVGVQDGEAPSLRFDPDLLSALSQGSTPLARRISQTFAPDDARKRAASGYLGLADDLAALYLVKPGYFAPRTPHTLTPTQPLQAREALVSLYTREPGPDGVVLRRVPEHESDYQPDVAALSADIRARHGEEEWRLAVLTSELHRHLGLWSLVGVKMGLRARELLGVGPDELLVTSRAGLQPPLSCLNDGLQVSTGATLGHGSIQVASSRRTSPQATFVHDDQSLTLRLRPDLAQAIRDDLKAQVEAHGGVTPAYFHDIRALALRWWLELDRTEAFEVVESEGVSLP